MPGSRRWLAILILGVSASLAACGRDETGRIVEPRPSAFSNPARIDPAPHDAPGRQIFPVHEGNRWRYRSEVVVRRIVRGTEFPPEAKQRVYDEVITWARQTSAGIQFQLIDPHGAYYETSIYRQDASGLYVTYVPFAPNGNRRTPGSERYDIARGPIADEVTVLSYPLHVGQHWL